MAISRRVFIKRSASGLALLAGASGVTMWLEGCAGPVYDLVIRNGMVLDGSGSPEQPGDIGVNGDRIVALGDLASARGRREIDAQGLKVCPGFVDIHSHTDLSLLVNPKAESKIRQGVTTEVTGQDGGSLAPLTVEMVARRNQGLRDRWQIEIDWTDFYGFFERLQQQGMALNLATFVGQGTLREHVIGQSDRPATGDEIEQMKELAVQALEQGAWGISSGLEYTPGSFATKEEIAALCKVLPTYKGIYATHIRNEDDRLVEAVDEAIWIAREAGTGLQISHLKASGQRNWGKLDTVLKRIEHARQEGLEVNADRYPYVAYMTGLSNLFPLWSREGGTERFLERLQDQRLLPQIRRETEAKVAMLGSWEAVMIAGVNLEKNQPIQGKRVGELTRQTKMDPFEYTRRLLIEEKARVSMCGFGMSEENTARILAHPLVMVASDGGAVAPYGPLGKGNPHPRMYGTFPRVIAKYVREDQALSLPQAIHKMSAMPAEKLGMVDRGKLQVGYRADIVVFDYQHIEDRANFIDPHQYPRGIPYVVVNGQVVIENGEHTGALPGRIIKRS